MDLKSISERYHDYFSTLSLSDLRTFGRFQGVHAATQLKKEILIEEIVNILTGKVTPTFPKTDSKPVGAPPKSSALNPEILPKLDAIKRAYEDEQREKKFVLRVASEEEYPEDSFDTPVFSGILEIMQSGYGFLRSKNCQPTSGEDVFVPAQVIHSMRLREGDFVSCTARPSQKNDSAAIWNVLSVNSYPIGKYEQRPHFDHLTAQYPNRKIQFSAKNSPLSLRVLDLFAPIGLGQRGLIVAPPKAGKTTLLKEIARSISSQYNDISLIVLLIDERPEEVTDFRKTVAGAEVIYSTFDEGAEHHIRAAELTLEHAKRAAEQGMDVVILLDSLTKLTRAYNNVTENSGKTLTGGLEASAFAGPKRFFGTARNTVEAGSVTILATALVDTGSRMDDVIYEEFKGTGNADIFLSRELAEKRIFPAIDITHSGTRKEELLLSDAELKTEFELRERGFTNNVAGILDMLKKTETNDEFIQRFPEWKKIFKIV